jgi:NADH:ubiquinone oxidoreductase subunit H
MESIAQLLQSIPNYDVLPGIVRTLLPMLVSCVLVFALLALAVLFLVWMERKVSAHI